MAKLTLNTIGSRYGSIDALNDNFNAIETAIENTFSLDGTSPNALEADLDMNSNDILNAGEVSTDTLRINGVLVEPTTGVTAGAVFQTYEFTSTAGQTTFSVSPATPYNASIVVIVNGLQLSPAEVSVSGTNVITPALTVGDEVVIRRYTAEPVAAPTASEINYTPAGTGAMTTTVQTKLQERVNVFDFMAASEIADVQAYTYTIDVTTKIQAAMNAAFITGCVLVVPAGGYRITTLNMPGSSTLRGKPFIMEGAGIGEVFAVVQGRTGATIFRNTVLSSAPVFRYVPDSVNTGNGFARISGIVFWGETTTGVAIVDFDSFYSQSRMFDCAIIQNGVGDGLNVDLCATPEFFNIYSINNPGWITSSGGGYVRTGTGFKFTCSLVGGAGLLKVRGTTSRGWDTGYQIGNGTNPILSSSLRDFECSNVKHGVKVLANCESTTINGGYFEGGDGGIGILDQGDYTTISDNIIYSGFGTHIDASDANVAGTTMTGNTLSAGSTPNSKLVKLGSSGTFGGAAKTFVGNTLNFSGSGGSIVGVVGISITGVDPQLHIAGNHFDPRGAWTGGAGTAKISNFSTSGDTGGNRATGDFGFGLTAIGNYNYPALNRGVISLAQLPAITTTSATVTIAAPNGGFYDVTFAGAQAINKIADGGQEGRILWLNVTNGNVTWTHNANLKLAGAVNWTPGANGGILILRVYGQSGGFVNAQEIGRVAY